MARKNRIFGAYELRARLGPRASGGMAEVFRATCARTGAPCVLKRLLPGVAEDQDFVRDFEDEARIAAALDHPNIARVLDYGCVDDAHFIAYELVDGVDLRVLFENASMAAQPLGLGFLVDVFRRVGGALAHAHRRDVVHRDVTPDNIVVSFDGEVKLIDFGIAKAKGRLMRTGAGVLKGKLGYMSPEQLRGEANDASTDLFSLGICMWELLTLKRLFSAPNEFLVLDMVKNHVPEPPSSYRLEATPEVAADLDRIVLKALAKEHVERYRSARQLTSDLDEFFKTRVPSLPPAEALAPSGPGDPVTPIARTLRRMFAPSHAQRSSSSIMEPQETRMSDDNKSGSDLDIFEGLGKKSAGPTSAAPPPPPGAPSSASLRARPANADMKRTLLGIPGPAQPPSGGALAAAAPAPQAAAAASPSSAPASAPAPSGRGSGPPPLPSAPPSALSAPAARTPSAPPGAASRPPPPPPPGRGTLPSLTATQPSQPPPAGPGSAPPPPSRLPALAAPPPSVRPAPAAPATTDRELGSAGPGTVPPPKSGGGAEAEATAATAAAAGTPKPKPSGGKLDMDWDDDDEATHVFDKEGQPDGDVAPAAGAAPPDGQSRPESVHPEHASMDEILRRPSQGPAAGTPPPPQGAPATMSAAFGALGQPRETTNGSPSAQFRSGAPPSQSIRSAPPPPPGSLRPQNPSTSTAPIPPPPPPGQTTTAPMHMPPLPQSQPPIGAAPPGSMPPQQAAQGPHAAPPPHAVPHSQPPMPQMPPVSRAMEATAVVPRQQGTSSAGLWIALLAGVVVAAGLAVFFLMPRSGTLVVNVADTKGAAVNKLEVLIDGKKACESAPCIVRDVAAGVHEVKVSAAGYDPPAARAVTVESRKDSSTDFSLSAAKAAGGTGLKVTGNPLQTGVRLVVDGKEIGPLPQELHDLTPGSHSVKIVASERYAPFEKTVEVKADEQVDLGNVALKVLKGKATIQLATPGAKVYVVSVAGTNRREVPQFPIAIDFDPSEKWNLEAKMFGMEDFSQPISFDDGQAEKTFVVSLSPKGATTAAATTAPVRTASVTPPPALVPPREPTAVAPREPVATAPVKKDPPSAASGGESFLNINSKPASTVVLDGKPLGPTPRVKVSVSAGTHTVLFVNAEESLKKSVSVTIAAGETKAVTAKLRD